MHRKRSDLYGHHERSGLEGDGALSLERRPIPALQGPRDAIVRVTRSTICTSDLHIRSGAVPRARPGVVLGHEFVGVVEAVGNGFPTSAPATGWPPAARASAATAGSAAGAMSTTASTAAGS